MCIYCTTTNYRKIYENHHGTIPKDEQGRSYHIHHIDGNHQNNNPENLKAVSVQEHFDIHYSQGDWFACLRLAASLAMSAEEKSEISRINNQKRVENGTHPFLSGDIQRATNKKRIQEGTHPFLSGDIQRATNKKRIQEGTHNLLGGKIQQDTQNRIVAEGKHPFQSGDIQRKMHKKHLAAGTHVSQDPAWIERIRAIQKKKVETGNHHFVGVSNPVYKELENGTHNFLGSDLQKKRIAEGTHHLLASNRKKVQCEHCGIITITTNYARWHGNQCKRKPPI
jgi:hypothetical protein